MQKKVLLISMIALLVFGSLAVAEDEMCVPMGEITIEKLAPAPQRPEVSFPHPTHFSYACQQCHHKWNTREPIVGCQTSGCHDQATLPETKKSDKNVSYYKEAYHSMCIGCHKEIKKKNKALEASLISTNKKMSATGPTACNQCHPKE
jgi:hypothetical protein